VAIWLHKLYIASLPPKARKATTKEDEEEQRPTNEKWGRKVKDNNHVFFRLIVAILVFDFFFGNL
jgi:hypothetical protein